MMPNLGGVQGCPSLATIDFIDDGSIVSLGLAVCHGVLDGEVILHEGGRVTYVPVAVETQPGSRPKGLRALQQRLEGKAGCVEG